jgi:type II secretory pathway component PulF
MFSARISNHDLAALCRRVSTSLASGVDLRRVFAREAEGRTRPVLRRRLDHVRQQLDQGCGLAESIRSTGNYFPRLFREMVEVGEQTGMQAEVFRQLADNYEHQVQLRRTFLAAIAWPLLQLSAAIGVIGLLILVLGMIPAGPGGERIDILGFGLVGVPGLIVYLLIVGAVVAGIALLVQAMRRGVLWTRPLQRGVMQLPILGGCLQTLALSRLAWAMHVTLGTSMSLQKSLPLSLRSTQNARYSDHCDQVVADVVEGREICQALERTGAFPRDFLDVLEVGERSGRLPESMGHLAQQYQDRGKRALATLTMLAGFGVWALVAAFIIFLIFRLASFYIGTIMELSKP